MKAFTLWDMNFIQERFAFFLRRHIPHVRFECVRQLPAPGYNFNFVVRVGLRVEDKKAENGLLEKEAKKYFSKIEHLNGITQAHVEAQLSIDGQVILLTTGWF